MINNFIKNSIITDIGKIIYYKRGDGPPVLLLHGYPQFSLMWEESALLLSQKYTTIIPNCLFKVNSLSYWTDYYKVLKIIISKFAINPNDTGSAEVQIAVLSERINNLIEHFKEHKHDNHSKKGLLAMVNKRKKLLNYLSKKDNAKYKELIDALNIRG